MNRDAQFGQELKRNLFRRSQSLPPLKPPFNGSATGALAELLWQPKTHDCANGSVGPVLLLRRVAIGQDNIEARKQHCKSDIYAHGRLFPKGFCCSVPYCARFPYNQ